MENALLKDHKKIEIEAKLRKNFYELISVKKDEVDHYIEEGWSVDRELKRVVKLKRKKQKKQLLIDKFWFLLYKLGYSEINKERVMNFSVNMRDSSSGKWCEEEIVLDVYAKDEETVVITKCFLSDKIKRSKMQKRIEEFVNYKSAIAKVVKKILWCKL